MKRLLFILLAMPLMANYSSCKKKPERAIYNTSKEFKDYVLFKTGSYWIYKLEGAVTNTDTNTLIKTELQLVKDARTIGYDFEKLLMHSKRTYSHDTLIIFGGALFKGTHGVDYYEELSTTNLNAADIHYFDGKAKGSIVEIYANRRTKYSDSLANYTIEGKTYPSVKVFDMLDQGYPATPAKVYFAKNVGIIRKELWNGQVWNLIKHQVSQ
jgi:hypothetical protein